MMMVRCLVVFAAMAAAVVLTGWDAGATAREDKKGDKDKGGKNKKCPSKDKNNKEDVPGARWAYTLHKGKDDKELESGKFRADGDKIYHGGNEIGTFKQHDEKNYTLNIKKGELKGEIKLVLVRNEPCAVFRGPCKSEKHGDCHIVVRFLED